MTQQRLLRRDLVTIGWIARWGSVTQQQIAHRFGLSKQWRRLRGLRDLGLLLYERPFDELPGVYTVTGQGAAAAGIAVAAPSTSTFGLWPHLAALDLVSAVEARGGRAVAPLELILGGGLSPLGPELTSGVGLLPDAIIHNAGSAPAPVVVVPQRSVEGTMDRLRSVTLDALLQARPTAGTERIIVLVDAVDAAQPASHVAQLQAISHLDVRLISGEVGKPGD